MPNIDDSLVRMKQELSRLLSEERGPDWGAAEETSPMHYAHSILVRVNAPCVMPAITLAPLETRTITLRTCEPKRGSRPAVLLFALFNLATTYQTDQTRRRKVAENEAWGQAVVAIRTALKRSETAADGREQIEPESGRLVLIENMSRICASLEATFPSENRVTAENAERTWGDVARSAIRNARLGLSPEFSDLEIGDLIDDGMGGDRRTRADRVRRERKRAEKSVDHESKDGPQRSEPWVVML